MARRRNRDWDVAMALMQLATFGLFLLLLFPAGRKILHSIHVNWIGIIGVAFVVLVLVVIIRKTARPPRPSGTFGHFETAPGPTQPKPPLTTEKLIAQLHTIDWFQFEKAVALAYRKSGYSVT